MADRILVMYRGRDRQGVRRRRGQRRGAGLLHDRRRSDESTAGRSRVDRREVTMSPEEGTAVSEWPPAFDRRAACGPRALGHHRHPASAASSSGRWATTQSTAYVGAVQGCVRWSAPDRRDAHALDAADVHGSGRRIRLPGRVVQHRSRGPALHGRPRRCVPRHRAGRDALDRGRSHRSSSAALPRVRRGRSFRRYSRPEWAHTRSSRR